MMKTVLVTGATGFIGSYLLPLLNQRNWQITATFRGSVPPSFAFPIRWVSIPEIDGKTNWNEVLQDIDTVIHLAGRAHILQDDSPDPEAEFFRVNRDGTLNLAKQAMAAAVKHFVFLSSLHAVSNQSEQQLNETSDCTPQSPYGRSKRAAEIDLMTLAKDSPLGWTILRPPLVYGAGNLGNMDRLIKGVKAGLPFPLASVANQRSLVYVGNLVDAIATCLDHPPTNQSFLLSDGQDLSTPALIRQMAQSLGLSPRLLPISPIFLQQLGNLGDQLQFLTGRTLPLNRETVDRLLGSLYVDNHHFCETFNWQPPFTVEQGFAHTLK